MQCNSVQCNFKIYKHVKKNYLEKKLKEYPILKILNLW